MAFTNFHVEQGKGTWDHGYVIVDENGNLVRDRGRDGTLLFWGRHEYPNAVGARGEDAKAARMRAAREDAQKRCDELNASRGAEMQRHIEERELMDLAAAAKRKQEMNRKRMELIAAAKLADEDEARLQLEVSRTVKHEADPPPLSEPAIASDENTDTPDDEPKRRGRPKKAK